MVYLRQSTEGASPESIFVDPLAYRLAGVHLHCLTCEGLLSQTETVMQKDILEAKRRPPT